MRPDLVAVISVSSALIASTGASVWSTVRQVRSDTSRVTSSPMLIRNTHKGPLTYQGIARSAT